MSKKVFKIIALISTIFIIAFPAVTQAKPVYVIECSEGDTECKENISNIDKAELENDQTLDVKKDSSLFISIIQTFFALLLVLILIYILIKLLSKRNKSFSQVKSLENIGGIPIGQNKSIQLVRVGSNVYMIGVGDNVELLEEITDPLLKEELIHKQSENDLQVNNLLSSLTNFKSKKKDKTITDESNNEFKSLFANELSKLKQTRTKIKEKQKQKEDSNE